MRLAFLIVPLLLAAGCGATVVEAGKTRVQAQGSQELACADAQVAYYGLRGKDIQGDSACFGPTADKLAVVQCAQTQQSRAYWGFADGHWEARPGNVTAVAADHVEISVAEGGSSLEAVAKCGH